MKELKDIKGIVTVPDDSFLQLMLTLGGGLLLILILVGVFLWLKKPKRRRQRPTPQILAREQLKTIDFKDTKQSLYAFSEATQVLIPEDERLQPLLDKLEPYKYRREVPPLEPQLKGSIERLIEELLHAK